MTDKTTARERIYLETPDIAAERLDQLRELFPEAFTEGRLDVEKLQEALGDFTDSKAERYSFSWAGKRDAIQILQTPSRATLVPDREESVNFDTTQNLFIEGDNLEVLKLLYKSYFGRVKMIYIDPPYNTGNDFIYPDNYKDPLDTYLKMTGQRDAEGNLLTSNPETSGRYHSAWLSMMYPRLFLARQLLREDGVIFISIDDHEVHNLRMLMNEIFGEENFVANIVWQKKYASSSDDQGIASMHDSILVYQKDAEYTRGFLPRTEAQYSRYTNPDDDPRGDWASDNYLSNKTKEERPTLYYPIIHPKTKQEVYPPEHAVWRYTFKEHKRLESENRLFWGPTQNYERPRLKRFRSELGEGLVPSTWWPHTIAGHNDEAKKQLAQLLGRQAVFSTPKPARLIKRLLLVGDTRFDDIVLDFFAGSCSTAQAVLALNREDSRKRHYVMVQLPEPTDNPDYPTIADIGKERIRRVIKNMEAENEGKLDLQTRETPEDLGFKVFKLTPSNFEQWQPETDTDYPLQLEVMVDPIRENWQPENIIYEIALKEGYSLTSTIQPVDPGPPDTWKVTDSDLGQSFIINLSDKLSLDQTKPLNLSKEDLFICRDSALTDETAANLTLQCRLKAV